MASGGAGRLKHVALVQRVLMMLGARRAEWPAYAPGLGESRRPRQDDSLSMIILWGRGVS